MAKRLELLREIAPRARFGSPDQSKPERAISAKEAHDAAPARQGYPIIHASSADEIDQALRRSSV